MRFKIKEEIYRKYFELYVLCSVKANFKFYVQKYISDWKLGFASMKIANKLPSLSHR